LDIIARSSNLLINPSGEQSAKNFPLYGWTKEDGKCDWSTLSRVTYGNKTIYPRIGSTLFAPIHRDNATNSVAYNSSKTYTTQTLPGLLPGGHRPGKHTPGQLTLPRGHKPTMPPHGIPLIPGLPHMKDRPGTQSAQST
jgi:hypothetical protein